MLLDAVVGSQCGLHNIFRATYIILYESCNVIATLCSMVCFVWLGLCLFQSPGRWEVVLGAVPENSDDRMPAE